MYSDQKDWDSVWNTIANPAWGAVGKFVSVPVRKSVQVSVQISVNHSVEDSVLGSVWGFINEYKFKN
jgi:hypothetical protein